MTTLLNRLQDVTEALHTIGENEAYIEEMGGGILCIWIPRKPYHFVFGVANETWGADIYLNDEFQDGQSINTNCPSDETDAHKIALALQDSVNGYLYPLV